MAFNLRNVRFKQIASNLISRSPMGSRPLTGPILSATVECESCETTWEAIAAPRGSLVPVGLRSAVVTCPNRHCGWVETVHIR
jgi:hypothetical protein